MISNEDITIYHKILDENKLDKWVTYHFEDVWKFGGKGASLIKGYENANDVDVRIPMEMIDDTSIFNIGDIIAVGHLEDIEWQSDLEGQEFYNITTININNFGNHPHIHLGGK